MPKARVYAGFWHLFYQMALAWRYLWGGNELDALFNVIYFMYPNGRKMLWQYM